VSTCCYAIKDRASNAMGFIYKVVSSRNVFSIATCVKSLPNVRVCVCVCVCLKYGHFLSVRLTVSRLGLHIRIICELFSSYETKLFFSVDIKT